MAQFGLIDHLLIHRLRTDGVAQVATVRIRGIGNWNPRIQHLHQFFILKGTCILGNKYFGSSCHATAARVNIACASHCARNPVAMGAQIRSRQVCQPAAKIFMRPDLAIITHQGANSSPIKMQARRVIGIQYIATVQRTVARIFLLTRRCNQFQILYKRQGSHGKQV